MTSFQSMNARVKAAVAAAGICFLVLATLIPGPSRRLAAPQRTKLLSTRIKALLEASRRHAGQLVTGSIHTRLLALRGVPVVVNQWASWCPECRQEFPLFRQQAVRYRRRVAFVGIDSEDQRSDARAFLRRFPVPYPSLSDPDGDQMHAIGGGGAWPTTYFFDATGNKTYIRFGSYASGPSLEADIKRYALAGSAQGRTFK